jgi:hypothetical protein
MALQIEMFPQSAVALSQEVQKHPQLCKELSYLGPSAHLEFKIAVIAKYVGIVLDGEYSEKRLETLFDLLLDRLRQKSKLIIH